jgi:hypothetical protein
MTLRCRRLWASVRLHPRVTALVDGDRDGLAYAKALSDVAQPPPVIVQWPADWTIEDVVGWILQAESSIIESLATHHRQQRGRHVPVPRLRAFAAGQAIAGGSGGKSQRTLSVVAHRSHSRQFGRTSAPIIPHFVQTIFGPNDGTVSPPDRWSTFMITRCRQLWH